ncbi:sensory box histidine kinase/response regulator [Legionella lansingensis]|uniref:Sensory box histidine kinase/response regulator n=1 Tax=Legionella lansingensis TaxID=45067 RepID=A0A0W0VGC6_9GAMM|nr:response regulator [Legionella lansingensis]KTD19154.1 sensory box histidine kinase/response regulator [Legionella lansingensis]SNV45429.1 sensory box histidine kinase/response regulator [Legionella lansingensis]
MFEEKRINKLSIDKISHFSAKFPISSIKRYWMECSLFPKTHSISPTLDFNSIDMGDRNEKHLNISANSKAIKEAPILQQTQAPHLLLVEDNIIALRLLESITKQAGCKFTSTLDGEKALELAKTKHFDLIVTDIGLPGMSGIEMTIYIRHWEQASKKQATPIVGLTAHSLASSAYECLEAGMNQVFAKPINLQTMKEIISTLVIPYSQKEPIPMESDHEMPENEDELFALDNFPLFNLKQGITNLGDINLLKELLNLMIEEVIPKDQSEIQKAYRDGDWTNVEKIAHKMKSGALYCGTTRWQYACQYLERYSQAGHSRLLNKLYQQLIAVLEETKKEIIHWLKQQEEKPRLS